MLTQDTIHRYFKALSTHDGALAASLFAEDGVIDDFRGKHHAGRAAIEKFIGQVPAMQLEFHSDFIAQGQRVTVYGHIHYPGKDSVLVRWVFTADGEQIAHLCNSRIEQVPESRRRQQ
jgi:SnoaL-like domain